MKQFATAAAAVVLSATAALGGTLTLAEPEPVVYAPAPAPAFNWTGGYVGLQAGGYHAQHRITFPENLNLSASPDSSGLNGGLYGGYNWHSGGSMVVGIEAEVNAFTGTGEAPLMINDSPSTAESWTSEVRQDAALRLRAGMLASDRTLVYATAGVAGANYGFEVVRTFGGDDEHSGRRTGWTAGVGLEHALNNGMSLRVDYRYSDYGSVSYTDEMPGTIDVESRLNTHQVRIGAAFRF